MADTFTSAQVCAATGATYRMLDSWLRAGYLQVQNAAPGSGHQRCFSFKEVLQVQVMVNLTNSGIQPRRVNPSRVIRDEGVYREDWATVTLDMGKVVDGLASKLGMKTDGVAV